MAHSAGGREDERGQLGVEGGTGGFAFGRSAPKQPTPQNEGKPHVQMTRGPHPPPLTARIAVFKYTDAFYNDFRLQQTLRW